MQSLADSNRARGFSLLEMMVAIAILALTLGALYQATSGATRNVRGDERHAYAVELARSLLAQYAEVPRGGLSTQGETAGGFLWQVRTRPVSDIGGKTMAGGALQWIRISVRWADGQRTREVALDSVVSGVEGLR